MRPVLLPLERRGGPADMVPGQLRTALLADEDYDWRAHLMATPPPRPVVEHVHPPALLTGIGGLEDDDLLAMAGSMAQLATLLCYDAPAQACADEVMQRGLEDRLAAAAAQEARDRVERFLAGVDQPSLDAFSYRGPGDLIPGQFGAPYDDSPYDEAPHDDGSYEAGPYEPGPPPPESWY